MYFEMMFYIYFLRMAYILLIFLNIFNLNKFNHNRVPKYFELLIHKPNKFFNNLF